MRKFWDNSGLSDAPPGAEARLQPVPATLQIGSVTISPATVLAPMAGVTDTVFRRFIKELGGCGMIETEFTSADGLYRMRESKRKRYLHFYDDEHPIAAQLFGSDPVTLAGSAKIVEEEGFDIVDLNLGCPAKRVVIDLVLARKVTHKSACERVAGACRVKNAFQRVSGRRKISAFCK